MLTRQTTIRLRCRSARSWPLFIVAIQIALLLLMLVCLTGCGGSSVDQESYPVPDPIHPLEALYNEGLLVTIQSDKEVYQQGERVTFWCSVQNQGSTTRTLELRATEWDFGLRSYRYTLFYYTPDGLDYVGVGGETKSNLVTKQVAPGETVRLVEITWDQVTSEGEPAGVGWYDVSIDLYDLLVDGRRLDDRPRFTVDLLKNIYIHE